jgi:hypothetical protein
MTTNDLDFFAEYVTHFKTAIKVDEKFQSSEGFRRVYFTGQQLIESSSLKDLISEDVTFAYANVYQHYAKEFLLLVEEHRLKRSLVNF